MKTLILSLVSALLVSTTAIAAPTGMVQLAQSPRSAKAEAKASWKQFKNSPKVATLSSGKARLGALGARTGGVLAAAGSAYAALNAIAFGFVMGVNDAVTGGIAGGALLVGGASAVGAWKAARALDRSANTELVRRAMAQGVEVDQPQLKAWGEAGIINSEAAK